MPSAKVPSVTSQDRRDHAQARICSRRSGFNLP